MPPDSPSRGVPPVCMFTSGTQSSVTSLLGKLLPQLEEFLGLGCHAAGKDIADISW